MPLLAVTAAAHPADPTFIFASLSSTIALLAALAVAVVLIGTYKKWAPAVGAAVRAVLRVPRKALQLHPSSAAGAGAAMMLGIAVAAFTSRVTPVNASGTFTVLAGAGVAACAIIWYLWHNLKAPSSSAIRPFSYRTASVTAAGLMLIGIALHGADRINLCLVITAAISGIIVIVVGAAALLKVMYRAGLRSIQYLRRITPSLQEAPRGAGAAFKYKLMAWNLIVIALLGALLVKVEWLVDWSLPTQITSCREHWIARRPDKRVLDAACEAVKNVNSCFLSTEQKVDTVKTFVELVNIRSVSGYEFEIRNRLQQILSWLGARPIDCVNGDSKAPKNLVMEFLATEGFRDKPGIILNAHIDTIWPQVKNGTLAQDYSPENLDYDPENNDFFHKREGSFGADDKAGVVTIVQALKVLKTNYWDKGYGHRRILVIFTAESEAMWIGAKYLVEKHPALFANTDITLTCDGFLSNYPKFLYRVSVGPQYATDPRYEQIIAFVKELSAIKGISPEVLGDDSLEAPDNTVFPTQAHSKLFIYSPMRGIHKQERVRLSDLLNHVDLFTHILMRLEGNAAGIIERHTDTKGTAPAPQAQ